MSEIDLGSDEYIVMKSQGVRYGGGMAGNTSELVLTNQNIILVRAGFLGAKKAPEYFPVRRVKVVDNRPQVFAEEHQLEIYFADRRATFGFVRKKEPRIWVDNLTELLVGSADHFRRLDDKALPGAAFLAESMRDTVDSVKRSLRDQAKSRRRVATTCASCGASISGPSRAVLVCEHCGSDQKLPRR